MEKFNVEVPNIPIMKMKIVVETDTQRMTWDIPRIIELNHEIDYEDPRSLDTPFMIQTVLDISTMSWTLKPLKDPVTGYYYSRMTEDL